MLAFGVEVENQVKERAALRRVGAPESLRRQLWVVDVDTASLPLRLASRRSEGPEPEKSPSYWEKAPA